MRAVITTSLLILAACSQPQPQAAPASSEPDAIEPGLWTVSRNVLSQKLGERQREVAIASVAGLETKCLMSPIGKTAAIQFMTDTAAVECRHDKAVLEGGKVDASLSCTAPPTHKDNIVTATGDYTPTSFLLTVEAKAAAIPPGEDIEVRQSVDAKRTGSC